MNQKIWKYLTTCKAGEQIITDEKAPLQQWNVPQLHSKWKDKHIQSNENTSVKDHQTLPYCDVTRMVAKPALDI